MVSASRSSTSAWSEGISRASSRREAARAEALSVNAPPVHERVRRLRVVVRLEHGLDLRYDKTSVTRWLRGQKPRGTTPALIAEVFTRRLGRRLTAQDLGLDACAPVYAGLEFAATPEEAIDIVGGLWRKDSGSHAELRKIAFTPAGLVVPSRDWLIGRADDRVGRGDPAATRVPPQGRPAVPRQRSQTERGPGQKVTGGDIAALRSVGELFRALDDAYGGGHARQALVRYLEHEAEPMLRGAYGEQIGRRLFAAAADLTRLAGWTSYDIGAHGLAQRYFVQALRLAHQINLAQMSLPRPLNEAPRFRPLDELPNIPPAPAGFDVSLVTDGRSYAFSIKDGQDPCRFAIFSDQDRWIYEGTPTKQAVILPAKEVRD